MYTNISNKCRDTTVIHFVKTWITFFFYFGIKKKPNEHNIHGAYTYIFVCKFIVVPVSITDYQNKTKARNMLCICR